MSKNEVRPISFQTHIISFRLITFSFIEFAGDSSQGNFNQKLTTLYNGVETFVLFIGYARSGHSLIGAILDAHPEIIIPHEWNAINKWDYYKHTSRGNHGDKIKTRLFFDLHSLSRFQAMFGNRAASDSKGNHYSYYVPGQWQGTYRDKIKVCKEQGRGRTLYDTWHFLCVSIIHQKVRSHPIKKRAERQNQI